MAAQRQLPREAGNAHLGYSDTPILPDSGYHVHDGERPQPPVVTPGEGTFPPSDALVLFDGTSLVEWERAEGGDAGWKIEHGYMEVVPKSGDIRTRRSFGDVQLHLEFASPRAVRGEGQGRGNSGVFLMGLYEIQVLDSYGRKPAITDCGGIYNKAAPTVNASLPAGRRSSSES